MGGLFNLENVFINNINHFESKRGSLLIWLESSSEIIIKKLVISIYIYIFKYIF